MVRTSTRTREHSEFVLSVSVLSSFLSKCWPIISLPPSLSNVNYPDRPPLLQSCLLCFSLTLLPLAVAKYQENNSQLEG